MASPAVVSVTESNATADDTSPFTVSRAAGVFGQLTIAIIAVDGNPTLTWPAGYTQFASQLRSTGFGIYAAYHFEDGSEGTTFDITSSASEKWAAIVYSLSGAQHPGTQAPEATTVDGSAATTTPNPPSITPTGGSKDYLFIAAICQDGEEADDDTWGNTPPTNYTPSPPRQKSTAVAGVATTNCSLTTAERALTTAGPEDPGTFSVDQSLTYVGLTIAVHPVTVMPVEEHDSPATVEAGRIARAGLVAALALVHLATAMPYGIDEIFEPPPPAVIDEEPIPASLRLFVPRVVTQFMLVPWVDDLSLPSTITEDYEQALALVLTPQRQFFPPPIFLELEDVLALPPPTAIADEDVWMPAPPQAILPPLPRWIDEDVPSLFGQPDEDLPPAPLGLLQSKDTGLPVLQALSPWRWDEQEPAGALFGQPDEDFAWQRLWGPPWPSWGLPNPQALEPWRWHEELPAGTLAGQPDEDYPPETLLLRVPKDAGQPVWPAVTPWQWHEELPAGALFGQPDEDLPPETLLLHVPKDAGLPVPQALTCWRFDEQIPAGNLFGVPEEQEWRTPDPARIQPSQPVLADDEIPTPPAPTLSIDDEAFLPTAIPQLLPSQPIRIDEDVPTLRGQPDEDSPPESILLLRPRDVGMPLPSALDAWRWDEQAPSLSGQPDEDHPVAWTGLWLPRESGAPNKAALEPWRYDEQIPSGSLAGVLEEEPWLSWLLRFTPWTTAGSQIPDEDYVPPPQAVVFEEDRWLPAPPPLDAPHSVPLWPQDATPVPPAPLAFEEDAWLPGLPAPWPTLRVVVDDELTMAFPAAPEVIVGQKILTMPQRSVEGMDRDAVAGMPSRGTEGTPGRGPLQMPHRPPGTMPDP